MKRMVESPGITSKKAVPGLAASVLSKHPVFSALSDGHRQDLLATGGLVRVPKYSMVFRQGDDVSAIYVILDGLVKLYRDIGDTDRTMGFLYRGEMLGLDSLYSETGYAYTAQALGPVTVLGIPSEVIHEVVASQPELSRRLLRENASRWSTALHTQDVMAYRSTNGRVADQIVKLAAHFGRVESKGTVLTLQITQRELASMAGTNRESVCKALMTFKREGSIDIQNKMIMILDRKKLESWP